MPDDTILTPRSLPSIPGYELLDEVGRGGMGVVYRARDLGLERDVAVKFLQGRYAGESAAAARFKAEAKITGQLQHPGIPAVHELGTLSDGRPFLAMKLVKGRTLQELLEETPPPAPPRSGEGGKRAGGNGEGGDPPSHPLRGRGAGCEGVGRFLAIFEQIAHAVGYAHAHGVIHRDLKPSNVMVGAFGEVQVMDWGLAKVLASGGRESPVSSDDPDATRPEPPSRIDTPHGADSPTRTGAVLGTPSYMPPEQAAGQVRDLDARSDVFGLGAILCQILTGRPPFLGKDGNEVRLQAVRGELQDAFARLDQCGAEPEVVALCKKCLSFKQEDRPATGQEVADAVAKIRNDAEARARKAELERAEAVVRAAEQRKRRRQFVRAACLVGIVLLLGIAGTSIGLVRANAAAEAEHLARVDAQEKQRLALEAKRQADDNFKEALDAVKAQVFDINRELENRSGTRDLREKLQKSATERLKKLVDRAARTSDVDHVAFWAYVNLGDVSLYADGRVQESVRLYTIARDNAARRAAADPSDAQAQRDLSISYERLGDVTRQAGQPAKALEFYTQGLDIRKKLAAADPSNTEAQTDLFVSYWKLGKVEQERTRYREAIAWFRKGLEVLRPLHAAGKLHGQFRNAVANEEKKLAACELLLKLSPALIEDPSWALLWGWPRH